MQHNLMDIEKTVKEIEELGGLQGGFVERVSAGLEGR